MYPVLVEGAVCSVKPSMAAACSASSAVRGGAVERIRFCWVSCGVPPLGITTAVTTIGGMPGSTPGAASGRTPGAATPGKPGMRPGAATGIIGTGICGKPGWLRLACGVPAKVAGGTPGRGPGTGAAWYPSMLGSPQAPAEGPGAAPLWASTMSRYC